MEGRSPHHIAACPSSLMHSCWGFVRGAEQFARVLYRLHHVFNLSLYAIGRGGWSLGPHHRTPSPLAVMLDVTAQAVGGCLARICTTTTMTIPQSRLTLPLVLAKQPCWQPRPCITNICGGSISSSAGRDLSTSGTHWPWCGSPTACRYGCVP
ncbi:hypothetical protein COO60DRAFT_206923 [Scenedesmus sp. NREL 46B-D3]|nr:hypothetical protein COO60DRAFT_206923 [Scenedesmus sp. NREL 46B-D3]